MKVKEAYELQKKLIQFFNENQNYSMTADDCFVMGRAVEIIRKSLRIQEISEFKFKKGSQSTANGMDKKNGN